MLQILFNNNHQFKTISYICIFTLTISILLWFILFSEPYKIYRNNKIQPIQYLL